VIDVHSHVLPGVDDGPKTWDQSVALCQALAADGITTAIATPHVIDHVYPNTRAGVASLVAELRARLAAAGIPLTVLAGGEVEMSCRHLTDPPFDDIPTLAGGRYLLIEVPATLVPRSFESLLFSLQARGMTPVIAHPERCLTVQRQLGVARGWRDAGAVLQLDAESVLGVFGDAAETAAHALIDAGLAHALASDSHSCRKRPPRLGAAARAIAELAGPEVAHFLVREGPQRIVSGSAAGEPPRPRQGERSRLGAWWRRLRLRRARRGR
jgi:protein-tyrosine phosphatase